MNLTGSFSEAMAKLWDLYLDGRIDELNAEYYLFHLRHPDGTFVFGIDDVIDLLEKLREAKEEDL